MRSSITKYTATMGVLFATLFLFQNCADFGTFSVDYSHLASLDPHGDAWRPVHGLEVKDGEWVKVEQKVSQTARTADRHYIASVLYRAFLPANTNQWTSAKNKPIRNLIDTYVHKNFVDFGGPCFFTNPEAKIGDTTVNCLGRNEAQEQLQVIPHSNVFRSSMKYRLCDKLLQNDNALSNFKENLKLIENLTGDEDVLEQAHQIFYLGQQPRKRTIASIDNLYSTATELEGGNENEGLRYVALSLCSSTGWEAP